MSKRITVIPATGGNHSDLTIEPGTTPRDIKAQLGLAANYVLTRGRGTEPIGESDDVYSSVTDGTKIYASTDVEWGGNLASSVVRFVERLFQPRNPFRPPRSVRNVACAWSPERAARAVFVRRAQIPYWKEKGWEQRDGGYHGKFTTRHGSWPGYATVSPSGRVEIFIHNPPRQLQRHPHWQCFRARSGGWYFVHPVHKVPDISAGVISMEKTIEEAYAI